MAKDTVKTSELYILPSFFTSILENEDSFLLEDNYSKGNFDQYTEIKKLTDKNITSKFKEKRYIPLPNGDLDYESDAWDFSQYSLFSNGYSIFHFENVSDIFKNHLKDFILLVILKGNIKPASIASLNIHLRPFLKCLAKKGISTLSDVDYSDVKEFLDSKHVAARTYLHYQDSIRKMLQFYDSENGTEVYTSEVSKLCERMEAKQLNAEIKNNERKPIPIDYFDKLMKILVETMDDTSLDITTRSKAAILVIDSQTGLRTCELSLLEADTVETITIDEHDYRMIHYKIIKTAKGSTGYTEHITYINDLSFKAYIVLMEVFKNNRIKTKSNLLFCPTRARIPVNPAMFLNFLQRLCILNADEIGARNSLYKDALAGSISAKLYAKQFYKAMPVKETPLNIIYNIDENTEFYFPVVHQFRNTVVDRLLREGVKIEFIRRYMGHLSVEMTARYADYNDTDIQEKLLFSDEVIRTYLSGEAIILGNAGKQLMESIDEWVKENKVNVELDLDSIVNKLLKIIPIRSKHGGMCIKGAKLVDACSVDAKTDEFYCACGVCPNICHFYFMVNVTYIDFKASIDIYNYDVNNGFTRQAEKELGKIKYLIAMRLNPEIIELEREIVVKGKQYIVDSHPELNYVIENLNDIKEEIKKWN